MPEITVEVAQIEQTSTSEGRVRQHSVLIDRPADKGGLDRGAMGGEMLLLALGGCFLSNFIAAAKARNLNIIGLRVRVRGQLEGTPPRFTAAVVEVYGQGPDEDGMQKLMDISERSCIVANTLKGSLLLQVRRGS